MRRVLLTFFLCGVAWGQIQPEAERLYRAAALTALQTLPGMEIEADTEVSIPTVNAPRVMTKHISVSVRRPDQAKVVVMSNGFRNTVILSGNSVWIEDEYLHAFSMRSAVVRRDSLLLPSLAKELLPAGRRLTEAQIVREESVRIDGKEFACTIIRVVAPTSVSGPSASDAIGMLWIDKQTGVALRQETIYASEHSGSSGIVVTRFLTGETLPPLALDRTPPAGFHESPEPFTRYLLALPANGPEFSFAGQGGKPITLGSLTGMPAILSFSASGCVPCDADRATFDAAAQTLKTTWGQAVRVIVASPAEIAAAGPAALPPPESPNYTTVFATPEQAAGLGIQLLPATMVVAPRGTIHTIQQGHLTTEELLGFVDLAKVQRPVSLDDAAMVQAGGPGVIAPVPTFTVPVVMTSRGERTRDWRNFGAHGGGEPGWNCTAGDCTARAQPGSRYVGCRGRSEMAFQAGHARRAAGQCDYVARDRV